MNISLCVITKNEENNIKRCLECVSDILFEKIVVDTGSADKTIEIAKNMGATVYDFEWIDDFSAARNFAISKAKGDWIVFLDADEHIESSQMELLEKLINLAIKENKECIVSKLINYIPDSNKKNMQSITTTVRVFKNDKNLRYFGAIHEMLRPIKNRQLRALDASESFIVYHSGYANEEVKRKDKSNRNLTLLFKELKRNPNNILTLFYIGESLMINHKFEEAVSYLEKSKELLKNQMKNNHPLLYKIYCNLLICTVRRNFEFKQFQRFYKEANEFDRECPDFYFYIGKKLYTIGEYERAVEYYELCFNKISSFNYNFESKVLSRLNNIYEELLDLYIMLENHHKIVEICVILLKADKYNYKSLLILIKTLKDFERSLNIYDFLFGIYSKDIIKDKLYVLRVSESLNFKELNDLVMKLLSEKEKGEYLQYKEQNKNSLEESQLGGQNLSANEYLRSGGGDKKINNYKKTFSSQKMEFNGNPQRALDTVSENHSKHNCNDYVEVETEKIKKSIIDLISKNLYEEALKVIDQSLHIVKDNADLYSIQAVVLMKQENYKKAKEALNLALKVDPEHIDSLYNLAYIYEQANQVSRAVDLYKKVLSLSNEQELLDEVKGKIINWQQTSRQLEMKRRFENSKYAKKQELILKADKSIDKIHIVYVLTHVGICGGVKIILEQANRLTRLGMNVSLVCHYPMPTWYPIEANYIEVPFDVELSTGISDCDVIVATYWDHIQSCVDKKIAPVIYFEQGDFHLFDYENMDKNLKQFIYQQYQLPQFIFTVTKKAADLIKKVYNRDSSVIHNAVDTGIFNNMVDNSCEDDVPYILMMGDARIKFKGLDQIIEAYKKVRTKQRDIQLYWITPSNPPSDYAKEVDKYFVNPSQHEISELYRGALLYVSASHYESFSLPVLEAMACGCPVVTTGNSGVLEYAEDNANVLITNIGDSQDIYKKILKVLGNNVLKNKLITNGLSTAKKFDWNNIILQLLNMYKEVSFYKVKEEHPIIVEERPKLSVILPVYNSEKFLYKTLDSILNQTYKNFELIIVNDGSADSSKDIINSFNDSRINYIYQENAGVAAARNKGLDYAKGHFITFHDSDDLSITNRFETLLQKFDYYNIDAVHSDMLLINEVDSPISYWQSKNVERDKILRYFIKMGTPFNNSTMVFKRDTIGNNRYDTSFKIGEDTKFVFNVVKNSNTLHIAEPLLLYRRHANNSTNSNDYYTLFSHVNSILGQISLEELLPELEWGKHSHNYNLARAKTIVSFYLYRRGMNIEAQTWINEALNLSKEFNDSNLTDFVLGIGNLLNKNLNEAMTLLSRITPRDHVIENYLGEVYGYKNNSEKAMKHFLNAIESYPNYVDALDNLKSLGGMKNYNVIDYTFRKYIHSTTVTKADKGTNKLDNDK
jgi:glycosyltransferase involved in cell wall biosynthesis